MASIWVLIAGFVAAIPLLILVLFGLYAFYFTFKGSKLEDKIDNSLFAIFGILSGVEVLTMTVGWCVTSGEDATSFADLIALSLASAAVVFGYSNELSYTAKVRAEKNKELRWKYLSLVLAEAALLVVLYQRFSPLLKKYF